MCDVPNTVSVTREEGGALVIRIETMTPEMIERLAKDLAPHFARAFARRLRQERP